MRLAVRGICWFVCLFVFIDTYYVTKVYIKMLHRSMDNQTYLVESLLVRGLFVSVQLVLVLL